MRSFNLLPWRVRQRQVRRRRALAAIASGAIAALVLLGGIELPLRQRLQAENERIAQLRTSISLARHASAGREALEARKTGASSLLAEVDRIRQGNSMARDWLTALPARIPAGLRLTGLTLNKEGWSLRGVAAELNQPAILLERVRQMPMVADVRMDKLQNNPDASRQFVVAGRFEE